MAACTISHLFCGAPGTSATRHEREHSSSEPASPQAMIHSRQPLPMRNNSMKPIKYTAVTMASETTSGEYRNFTQVLQSDPKLPPTITSAKSVMGQMEHGASDVHAHYQRMVQTLSMSNSALIQEAEGYRSRYREMREMLDEHFAHLNNIYHTLYASGISTVRLPEGEMIDLSRYRGTRLEFLSSSRSPPDSRDKKCLENEKNIVNDILAERLNCLPTNDSEKEALKVALLKCLTKSKYDDLDDYVNWLNDRSTKISPQRLSPRRRSSDGTSDREMNESPLLISLDDNTLSVVKTTKRKVSEIRSSVDVTSEGDDRRPSELTGGRLQRMLVKAPGANRSRAMSAFTLSRRNGSGASESQPRRSLANLKSIRLTPRTQRRNLI